MSEKIREEMRKAILWILQILVEGGMWSFDDRCKARELMESLKSASGLLEPEEDYLIKVVKRIANWEYDIQGDCVKDAQQDGRFILAEITRLKASAWTKAEIRAWGNYCHECGENDCPGMSAETWLAQRLAGKGNGTT